MRILLIHNHYQQRGGEDTVFEREASFLAQKGNQIFTYEEDNHLAEKLSKLEIAARTIWSRESYQKIRALIQQSRPQIVHIHNTFFAISPAAYYACRSEGIPVIQTLHNYRLLCPVATFYRDDKVCEECLGRFIPWPGIYHRCYRRSRTQTASVAGMLTLHRIAKTWQNQVDRYITLTEFARKKFIEGGLPAEKIVVKPNFLYPSPEPRNNGGDFAIFVGRLSPEKGIHTLIEAWKLLDGTMPLKIIGDGPLRKQVEILARTHTEVEFLGKMEETELLILMKSARFLVLPSECYEGFPMAIIEAFANQLPVIAPNLGSSSELVSNYVTGLHFIPGDPADLAQKVQWAWEHPEAISEMGRNARKEYEAKYTAERNYNILMDIYQSVLEHPN